MGNLQNLDHPTTCPPARARLLRHGLGYLLGALVTAALVRHWGAAAVFRAGMALTVLSLAATAVSDAYGPC